MPGSGLTPWRSAVLWNSGQVKAGSVVAPDRADPTTPVAPRTAVMATATAAMARPRRNVELVNMVSLPPQIVRRVSHPALRRVKVASAPTAPFGIACGLVGTGSAALAR